GRHGSDLVWPSHRLHRDYAGRPLYDAAENPHDEAELASDTEEFFGVLVAAQPEKSSLPQRSGKRRVAIHCRVDRESKGSFGWPQSPVDVDSESPDNTGFQGDGLRIRLPSIQPR